ncbi:MAG: sulfite exporter TauE/SafE family protein [Minicystis sp.]
MNTFVIGSAFLMGLFGGVHCVLMCGGVVGTLCARAPNPTAGGRARDLAAYNAGRILTYSALGAFAGGVGAASASALPFAGAQIALRLGAALIMVGAGLYLAGVFRSFGRIEGAGGVLFRAIGPLWTRLKDARSLGASVGLGALWGFLPCGMVYAAVAMALASGSAAAGGLTLLAFGLGTLPALLIAGGLAEAVRRLSRNARIRQTAGLLIALSGSVHLLMAGMQAGWVPSSLTGEKPPCCAGHHHDGAADSPHPGTN